MSCDAGGGFCTVRDEDKRTFILTVVSPCKALTNHRLVVCVHIERTKQKKQRLNVRTMIIITKVIDCLGLFTLNRHEREKQEFTFVAECFHRNCEEKFVRDEIFTGVCLSTGEGACMVGGLVCVAGGGGRAWQGVCMTGVCVVGG